MAGQNNSNDVVFANAFSQVLDTFADVAGRSAEGIRREVDTRVQQYVDQFYSNLVTMGMNVGDAPSELGVAWAPLTLEHSDFKASKGYQEGFFGMRGTLAGALSSRSATKDFGKHRVDVGVKGSGRARSGYSKRGGYFRDAQGRFASLAMAYESLNFTVTVELFPLLKDRTGRQIFQRLGGKKGGAGKRPGPMTVFAILEFGARGAGERNLPARPLLRPFLDWYATTNLSANMKTIAGR